MNDRSVPDLETDSSRRPTHQDVLPDPVVRSISRISRTTLNYCVDIGLFLLFLMLWWSTLVLRFVFPPGAYAAGCRLWGGDYSYWLGFQFGVLVAFSLGVLLHVMLHWTWVCSVTAKLLARGGKKAQLPDDGLRTIYGVAVLIVALHLVGLAALAARLTIQTTSG
jgi:hypothetical protein